MCVRIYVRRVFDGNPMPCRKKRVNDYGAAPEAAQWNGSMDEPPVASLADQPSAQGTFDNLCRCIQCTRTRAFLFRDSSASCVFFLFFLVKVSPYHRCFTSLLFYYLRQVTFLNRLTSKCKFDGEGSSWVNRYWKQFGIYDNRHEPAARVLTFETKLRLLPLQAFAIQAIDVPFSLPVSIHPYLLISIYLSVDRRERVTSQTPYVAVIRPRGAKRFVLIRAKITELPRPVAWRFREKKLA